MKIKTKKSNKTNDFDSNYMNKTESKIQIKEVNVTTLDEIHEHSSTNFIYPKKNHKNETIFFRDNKRVKLLCC